MSDSKATIILRHRRENLKKCSLRGLESRADFAFYTYPRDTLPNLSGYIALTIDAEPLSPADSERGLFLIDGTWRLAEKMLENTPLPADIVYRSLPAHIRTAYPRRQEDCFDPERGLASVEALWAAFHIMGRDTTGLLDNYHWSKAFLEMNKFSTL